MTRSPFKGTNERAIELLGIIHTDVCGAMTTEARGGYRYFITFTDDMSRYGYIYLMSHKSESFEKFKEFQNEVETQSGKKIKVVRSDRGGEYLSHEFEHHLKNCGIVHSCLPQGTPQLNGVSERRNRTLLDMVRSMMSFADLPVSFWGYALTTAVLTLNRTPSRTVDKTPYEIWTGKGIQKEVLDINFYNPTQQKNVKTGDIYDASKVVRCDKGLGLLLEIPSAPASVQAYVGREVVLELASLGSDTLDGLAMATLKRSLLEGSVFTHSDAKPGMLVKGKVIVVDSFGALVQISDGVKALCPLPHMSEFDVAKPGKKFKGWSRHVVSGSGLQVQTNNCYNTRELFKSADDTVKLGSFVSGVVEKDLLIWMKLALKPGYEFDKLLVLGFAPRRKVNCRDIFHIGQSVRSNILDVAGDTGRITLSLKQSFCSSTDASFLQEYFLTEEKVAKLKLTNSEGANLNGLMIFPLLAEKTVTKGSQVQAAVLDIAKAESLVDLSLKPEFIDKVNTDALTGKKEKKRKRGTQMDPQLHQTVNAVVEIVKDNYLVKYGNAIGYASVTDYNTQNRPPSQFVNGQSLVASVMDLPASSESGRLLLLLKSTSHAHSSKAKRKVTETKPLEIRVKFGANSSGRIHITEVTDEEACEHPFSSFKTGQSVTARIVGKSKKADHCRIKQQWELSLKPSIVMGPANELDHLNTNAFNFSVGQPVTGYVSKVDSEWVWLAVSRCVYAQMFRLDSSTEPTELTFFEKRFQVGQAISGYVLSVNQGKKILRLVPCLVNAAANDSADGCGLSTDRTKSTVSNENLTSNIRQGNIVGGRISRILPSVGGLLVQIGPHLYGKVHYTEQSDMWVSEPSSEYEEGQFVKCMVLEVSLSGNNTIHVDLSLRSSLLVLPIPRLERIEDVHPGMAVQGYVKNTMPKGCFIMLSRKLDAKILLSNLSSGFVEDLNKEFPIGKLVTGRVVSVEPQSKRVEVTLKTTDASNALKTEISDISNLSTGQIICGVIKRVVQFGLFIRIERSNLLAITIILMQRDQYHQDWNVFLPPQKTDSRWTMPHSEISDDQIDNPESVYKAGDVVRAKILKVDEESQRISFGMKKSYLSPNDSEVPPDERTNVTVSTNDSNLDTQLRLSPETNFLEDSVLPLDFEMSELPTFTGVESRAFVPPLEVTLEDMELPEEDNLAKSNDINVDDDNTSSKVKKGKKKKAKEEREREISAAEERQLEGDIPRTADDYEKLVRISPSSSIVWINYIRFLIDMGDIDKARLVAERAVSTISYREETETLNAWVAYINLENKYGNPPEEAVQKIFERALQHCDSEKLHLAMFNVYERTGQSNLADELIDKMSKKLFKKSIEVWLRRVRWFLKQHPEEVKDVVSRALLSLPRDKHIDFITKAAILEYKLGSPDRGRSLFEGILKEYPKRTGLVECEIRLGDTDVIRSLFERAISLNLKVEKMKFLFKKYLDYEKSIGDEERIEHVKTKAMEFVESHAQ
ncbi:unnamed protein product [Rhodiola kirilowii]